MPVVLAKNWTENVVIDKSLTLDLNGKTLTGDRMDSVVTITGENIETLYEKQCTFALDNKDLYLTDNSQIIKINKKTLKQETIKKVENRAIALVNNKIVYATGTQLKMMSLNGKDNQILFKNIVVSDLQVLGSDLFTKGYVQESGVKYIVFNIKGQYKALNENTAQEFENLQDA